MPICKAIFWYFLLVFILYLKGGIRKNPSHATFPPQNLKNHLNGLNLPFWLCKKYEHTFDRKDWHYRLSRAMTVANFSDEKITSTKNKWRNLKIIFEKRRRITSTYCNTSTFFQIIRKRTGPIYHCIFTIVPFVFPDRQRNKNDMLSLFESQDARNKEWWTI